MNEITRMFGAQQVRIIQKEDTPWFVAKDVADILGYSETAMMTRRLDEDEVKKLESAVLADSSFEHGGARYFTIISESGLYNAVIGSKKPEAKAFRKWVTSEVLPSIRKEGRYSLRKDSSDSDMPIQFSRKMVGTMLKTIRTSFVDDPEEYFGSLRALFFCVNSRKMIPPVMVEDIMRLSLEAIAEGRDSIVPGQVVPESPFTHNVVGPDGKVKGIGFIPEKKEDPSPASANQEVPSPSSADQDVPSPAPADQDVSEPKISHRFVDLSDATMIRHAQSIRNMSTVFDVIKRIVAKTGNHLSGIPVPIFDFNFPLSFNNFNHFLNLDELSDRMELAPEVLEQDVREYAAEIPHAFRLQMADFDCTIRPQIEKYGLVFNGSHILVGHVGAVLLAYLHEQYREIPVSVLGSDLSLRRTALKIVIQKGLITEPGPFAFRNLSIAQYERLLAPFGGYQRIIDDDWKETM